MLQRTLLSLNAEKNRFGETTSSTVVARRHQHIDRSTTEFRDEDGMEDRTNMVPMAFSTSLQPFSLRSTPARAVCVPPREHRIKHTGRARRATMSVESESEDLDVGGKEEEIVAGDREGAPLQEDIATQEKEGFEGDGSEGAPARMEFPQLYDAWFGSQPQLATQVQQCVTRAFNDGVRMMELQWPAVPNLEEIAAGTMLNFEFGKQVAGELGMATKSDYPLIKRYLASFCNLYWVIQIARSEVFRSRTVWAISGDAVSKTRAEGQLGNVRLASLRRPPKVGDGDVVVVIDPRFNEMWEKGARLRPPGDGGTVIFLNSQFNENYGLTGPRTRALRDTRAVYFLKRITRGYIFFTYPGPWRALLENPDLSVEEIAVYDEEPKLRDAALAVREESNRRYGGFYNDRYVRGFGGRL